MRDFRRNTLRHVAATLLAIVLALVVCWLLSSCKTTEVVKEIPVVTEHTTIQHHTDIVRDTLLMRDSVFHYVKGDTVIIEKYHHIIDHNKMVITDTIHDTIPKVVEVTKTITKAERGFPWLEVGLLLACFIVCIIVCKKR